MKSVSGIRGIVGESLTLEKIFKLAKQFGVFSNKGKILIGRDSRKTGKMIFQAVSAALMSVGCDVENLGICPTPTILLQVEDSDAAGGIAITASHNPKQWNALKLITTNGTFLNEKQSEQFWSINPEKISENVWNKIGLLTENKQAIEHHINRILNLDYIDTKNIQSKKYKVVIDSTNGAGGVFSPLLLKKLGCKVIELYSETSGDFSRIPEPSAENLQDLEKIVRKEKADIGFATDPDVDRLSVVSNDGVALGTEYTLGLIEDYVLSITKGNIATNLSSSMLSDRIAEKYGVEVFRAKVGEINVAEKMKENSCVIGGEGNGGIILPDLHFTRDAPMAMALILSYMAKTDKTVAQLADRLPKYKIYKTKVPVNDKLDFLEIMKEIKRLFPNEKYDLTDGIKIVGNAFWLHVRKSGTEPIVRIYAESDSLKISKKLVRKIIALFN